MMRVGTLLICLLLAPALAGCVGGTEEAIEEAVAKSRAEVTESTGGIEGLVTDQAIQPIQDALILLHETGDEVRSQDDGSFAFSNLRPGPYTVQVSGAGIVGSVQEAVVRPGDVQPVDFVVARVAGDAPYTSVEERSGFMECGAQIGWEARATTDPVMNPVDDTVNTTGRDPDLANQYGLTWFFLGIAACGAPNAVAQNTTNDKFIDFVDLDAPIHTLIYEMVWESGSTQVSGTTSWLSTNAEIRGYSNNDDATLMEAYVQSPAYIRVDRDRFLEVAAWLADSCVDGNEASCFDPTADGWPLQLRVFPSWNCAHEMGGGCVVSQQKFTHFLTGWFNGPAPEGYSALQG